MIPDASWIVWIHQNCSIKIDKKVHQEVEGLIKFEYLRLKFKDRYCDKRDKLSNFESNWKRETFWAWLESDQRRPLKVELKKNNIG